MPNGIERLVAPRFATRNTHGTGCTLSSAIAAGLAKGMSLIEAARVAKSYVTTAIAAADRLSIGSDRVRATARSIIFIVLVRTMLQRQFRSEQ